MFLKMANELYILLNNKITALKNIWSKEQVYEKTIRLSSRTLLRFSLTSCQRIMHHNE